MHYHGNQVFDWQHFSGLIISTCRLSLEGKYEHFAKYTTMCLTTSFYPFSSAFDRRCCILLDPVETLNDIKKNSVINFLRKVAEDGALKLNTAGDTLVERNEEIKAIGIKLANSNVRASRYQSQRDTGQNSINSL